MLKVFRIIFIIFWVVSIFLLIIVVEGDGFSRFLWGMWSVIGIR